MLAHFLPLTDTLLKTVICFLASFSITFLSIRKYIQMVKEKGNFFQPIRADGPESHVKTKAKTPTMGGFFIVIGTILPALLLLDLSNGYIPLLFLVFISFAAIGLTDDLMKVLYKNTKGFRGSIKICIQFAIIGVVFLCLTYIDPIYRESTVFLPFGNGYWIHLNMILYVIFVTFVIVGTSNAVNLTDGLDGLVSVPAIINLLCLIALTFVATDPKLAEKFQVPEITAAKEIIFFCFLLTGSIVAFLIFNLKPAKIFMGDVGSLAIGSVLGLIAIILKQEIIFFVISLLFVMESVSVILQVGSYKLRKKRIFLMAPIHHHFEKLGWSEIKVVRFFWILSLFFASLGALILTHF